MIALFSSPISRMSTVDGRYRPPSRLKLALRSVRLSTPLARIDPSIRFFFRSYFMLTLDIGSAKLHACQILFNSVSPTQWPLTESYNLDGTKQDILAFQPNLKASLLFDVLFLLFLRQIRDRHHIHGKETKSLWFCDREGGPTEWVRIIRSVVKIYSFPPSGDFPIY